MHFTKSQKQNRPAATSDTDKIVSMMSYFNNILILTMIIVRTHKAKKNKMNTKSIFSSGFKSFFILL